VEPNYERVMKPNPLSRPATLPEKRRTGGETRVDREHRAFDNVALLGVMATQMRAS
jgi:hypothetical protein